MENKTLFKLGQTVYDSALFGDLEGKVIVCNGSIYPIIVKFGDERFAYTYDGRLIESVKPTLTDQLYKVEYVQPQPQIELPEIGQFCWFWSDAKTNGYYFGQFKSYDDEIEAYWVINGGYFKYCSTTNPTEQ